MIVTEHNSWMHRTYYRGKTLLKPEEVESVEVKWPDGTTTREAVRWVDETVTCHDHGHAYPVTSSVPYLDCVLRGLSVQVPLTGRDVTL